jgi:LysR family hca operon transcriptional activator
LRTTIEDFKRNGLTVGPAHQAENLAMAISLIASTGGIILLPLYAQNLLKFLLAKLEEIKFQISSRDGK